MPKKLFLPGNPGGPGRPPQSKEQKAFKERCQEFMDVEGFDLLQEQARMKKEWAIRILVEYAYGRPKEFKEVDVGDETVEFFGSMFGGGNGGNGKKKKDVVPG